MIPTAISIVGTVVLALDVFAIISVLLGQVDRTKNCESDPILQCYDV